MTVVAYVAGLVTLPVLACATVGAVIVWDRFPRRRRQTWHPSDGEIRRFFADHH